MGNSELEAKERIINAAVKLFAEKGFDGTTVSEIAEQAQVNKALIYYYFKSKADILDYLVQTLLTNVTKFTMDFVHPTIEKMVMDGSLTVESDQLHFRDLTASESFVNTINEYYGKLLDYALEHRQIVRIIMLESLKENEAHNNLFKMLDFSRNKDERIYSSISQVEHAYNYSNDLELFRLFFMLIPVLNFAAYCDDYSKITKFSEEVLNDSFIRSFKVIISSIIKGSDILLHNNNHPERSDEDR